MSGDTFRLRIVAARRVEVDTRARRLVAEGGEGSFGILPRHADYVTVLVPGILVYETGDGVEHVLGVDAGALVKQGEDVRVAVPAAVRGEDLEGLRDAVEARFRRLDEQGEQARAALGRLESHLWRRFTDLERLP